MKKFLLSLILLTALCGYIFAQEEFDGTGTGFFINDNGVIITCDHVINGAASINVLVGKDKYPAKLLARNAKTDLAVLQINYRNPAHFKLAKFEGLNLGDKVAVLGFPLIDQFGKAIRYTDGSLSARTGFKEDPVMFQHSAPTHPGNSGGPILNASNEVIGIAAQVMSAEIIKQKGIVPQNINFGVKSEYVNPVLNKIKPGNGNIKDVNNAEQATVLIEVIHNKFNIGNRTGIDLSYLEIKASNEDFTGNNILRGGVFHNGASGNIPLPYSDNGKYDIMIADRPNEFLVLSDQSIRPGQKFDLPAVSVTRGGTRSIKNNTVPTIHIINKTGELGMVINVMPASSKDWGSDRLRPTQVLPDGAAFSVKLKDRLSKVSTYNIRIEDNKGNVYAKMNVEIADNFVIELTAEDKQ